MPTGYTAPIEEDPDFTFEQYVWRCARAFLMWCRDNNGPIPEKFPVETDTYTARIKNAETEIRELNSLTLPQVLAKTQHTFERHHADWETSERNRQAMMARYDAMQAKVEAWDPKDKLVEEGLKAMCLEQIATSTEYMRKPMRPPSDPPLTLEAAKTWKEEMLGYARKDLEQAKASLATVKKANAQMNAWLTALRATVPQTEYTP